MTAAMDYLSEPVLAMLIGLGSGILLGLAARVGRFCTLGAIENALYANDYRGACMWGVALAVAILGVFGLEAYGAIDLTGSIYAQQQWNPLACIVGGLLFGYGMALAGSCGYGALSRCGGGDLRAFVIVLVLGISASMALGGPTGLLRVAIFPSQPNTGGLGTISIAHAVGDQLGTAALWPAAVIAALMAVVALSFREFRRSGSYIFWSVVVGVAVVLGWWGTSWIATNGFDGLPVVSHTYTAPMGQSVLYLMTASAGGVSFGIGSVAGVIAGAFIGSLVKRNFRLEAGGDPRTLGRQMFGAFLMGTGGVISLGCSIGQGLTAFSMLAFSAPLTLAAIVLGAAAGLRQRVQSFEPAE